MPRRREVGRANMADIDLVLLELFADQLLLERAAGPEALVARPALERSAAKAGTRRRKRPPVSSSKGG